MVLLQVSKGRDIMKKTPLYQWHVANGANMAEFGSYLMPLWYPAGARKEHLGVIESAGLFDTSHMAVVLVEGPGSYQLLQKAISKDLDRCLGAGDKPLAEGRCVYGVFLNEQGHVIDDAIVYKRGDTSFMVVVNAGMGRVVAQHLGRLSDSAQIQITDLTEKLGKIDIQGPASARILGKLLQDPQNVFAKMMYFSFKGWFGPDSSVLLEDGTPILLSRTGYTGEFGFEIFVEPEHLEKTWNALLEIGGPGITPCGLAARDSLRAGAALPLSHQDIGDWPFSNNPWEFVLPLDSQGHFTKFFVGSESLQKLSNEKTTYPFAGFDPRKIVPDERSGVIDSDGNPIGEILTCATDMAIGRIDGRIISIATPESDGKPKGFQPKGLCCGFVRVSGKYSVGDRLYLTDGKRKLEIEIREDVRPDRTARRPIKEMV